MLNSLRRIYGLFIRQIYLIRRSPPRLIMHVFWPTVFMLIWGFLNKYVLLQTHQAVFVLSSLLGANLFSQVLERSNLSLMMGFMEDVWSRNISNVLISPLRTRELIAALILNGSCSMLVSVATAACIAFFLFDYNMLELGMSALGLAFNLLLTGWAAGLLIVSTILYFGASAEYIAWVLIGFMTPFICVYYPVNIMPPMLQHLAWALPPTYSFEGLRYLLAHNSFNWQLFAGGLVLNGVWLGIGFTIFSQALFAIRKRGGIIALSE